MDTETTISDEYMQQMLRTTENYCFMVLRAGPTIGQPGVEKIIWEHGRRNFRLRAAGVLAIVCPIVDDHEIKGIGIFNASVEETRRIMEEDPGVLAGVLTYELHLCRGFPGDSLARSMEGVKHVASASGVAQRVAKKISHP